MREGPQLTEAEHYQTEEVEDTPPAIWAIVAFFSGLFWIAIIAGLVTALGGK